MSAPNHDTDHARSGRSVWRKRWRRLLALSVVTYLAAAALAAGGAPGLSGVTAFVVALGLAWRSSDARPHEGPPSFVAALALASVVGGVHAPSFVRLAGDAALTVSFALAALAVAKLAAPTSLASALSPPRPILAIAPIAITAMGVALSAPGIQGSRFDFAASLTMTLALLMSGVAVALVALGEMFRRRYLLGVRARALGAFACMTSGLAVALGLTRVLPSGFSDVALRAALAPAAFATTMLALRAGELEVARTARLLTVLSLMGGGLVLFALDVSLRAPREAAAVVGIAGVLALLAGAASPRLADGLRPERGIWLDAIARAEDALLRDGTEDAVREALLCLRAPAGPHAASPELWSFDPVRVVRIDAAGYAHDREGTYPAEVVRVASEEPEATLRVEVLRELEVRRPDLRPTLRWLVDRGALAAVVVTESGEARGLLVVPEGARRDPMTLEEVIALKRLGDRFAGISGFRAALQRGLARERALGERIDGLEDRLAQLEHASQREAARHQRATLRLARPATVGLYAASSRLSFEALEARTRIAAPLVVRHPSGVDPVPYIARAHLSGARAQGALVLVEGTAARDHERDRWIDPVASPLALADRGVLLLIDGAALPIDIQRLIAQSLAEKRAPWERAEPLDVVLALTTVTDPSVLVERGQLDAALAARLGDALASPIQLPGLADRAEDLRSLLTDRLAREGLRVMGEPAALTDGALAGLVEHGFPGDETELANIVQRLVARAALRGSPLIKPEDVEALNLPADPPEPTKIRLV